MKVYFVDAFTKIKFRGNPAAVCYLNKQIPDEVKQKIATEIGFSETAFVMPLDIEKRLYSLQWFTPGTEINLCGHATLATSRVLLDFYLKQQITSNEDIIISYQTKSGLLSAYSEDDKIVLKFPIDIPQKSDKDYSKLLTCLNIEDFIGIYECLASSNVMIVLKSEEEIKQLNPDFNQLKEIDVSPMSSIVITASSQQSYDFVSRCFAPWESINEDPVTGSTHTALAPYWSEKLNKKIMIAKQLSHREGELFLELTKDHLLIKGQSVITLCGEFYNEYE